jgi:hypothetical protein
MGGRGCRRFPYDPRRARWHDVGEAPMTTEELLFLVLLPVTLAAFAARICELLIPGM